MSGSKVAGATLTGKIARRNSLIPVALQGKSALIVGGAGLLWAGRGGEGCEAVCSIPEKRLALQTRRSCAGNGMRASVRCNVSCIPRLRFIRSSVQILYAPRCASEAISHAHFHSGVAYCSGSVPHPVYTRSPPVVFIPAFFLFFNVLV